MGSFRFAVASAHAESLCTDDHADVDGRAALHVRAEAHRDVNPGWFMGRSGERSNLYGLLASPPTRRNDISSKRRGRVGLDE
jgi:hypothetical protein